MSKEKLEKMKEGGAALRRVKWRLNDALRPGVTAAGINGLAESLIRAAGGEPSFKKVAGYSWATCINVNEGVVHGIPKDELVFSEGDVVSVDVGMKYKGYHTDTSFSILLGDSEDKKKFLEYGRETLRKGIGSAKVGAKVGDISRAIEVTLRKHSLTPITSLTGHGIGKNLHEPPLIPCFVSGSPDEEVHLYEGMTLAIEVIYAAGEAKLNLSSDGWTLSTKDAKLAGLFEETVAVTADGPVVLTASDGVLT